MICIDLSGTALQASNEADNYSSLYIDFEVNEEYCQGFRTDLYYYDSQ